MDFWNIIKIFAFVAFITANSVFCLETSINLGSFVGASENGSSWVSPSGEFAFGFQPFPSTPAGNQVLYLLAIWYDKIPEKTIVWSKNEHPIPEKSRVQLTDQGQLVLSDFRGREIWRAPLGNGLSTGAAMLDSGNLVLAYGNSSIWESFNHPTDTMLPGQRLSEEGNLTCRKSETDYAEGRFTLSMQGDGNLVIYSLSLPTKDKGAPLWVSDTAVTDDSQTQLIFDTTGYMYLQQGNKTIMNVTNKDLGSQQGFYYMARLDFDGVLRLYIRHRMNDTARGLASVWTPVQTIPEDICRAYGTIGPGCRKRV